MDEKILRKRMHGLFLTRGCDDIVTLSRELMGLHCWFHRNVVFSALIRGANINGWKNNLTKTWLYRGTLHGVAYDDLPTLLALHTGAFNMPWTGLSESEAEEIIHKIIAVMEDGVNSRSEMRKIFAYDYDETMIEHIFSSWGGIFVHLARNGKVAFKNMTSRDFDLISAEPTETAKEVLPRLIYRYFETYGPATIDDAVYFLGIGKERREEILSLDLSMFSRLDVGRKIYYFTGDLDKGDMGDIPELTLLSGFDPLIVSYTDRSAILPLEYRSKVILKSGICLPTVAVNGKVAGIWNIKKNEIVIEFFEPVGKHIKSQTEDLVEEIMKNSKGNL